MPRFTHVEVYPPTGWPDRLWGDPGDTEVEDAFLRASRSVCELYDESLRDLRLARAPARGPHRSAPLSCGGFAGTVRGEHDVTATRESR